jgi:hypothetical protein
LENLMTDRLEATDVCSGDADISAKADVPQCLTMRQATGAPDLSVAELTKQGINRVGHAQ